MNWEKPGMTSIVTFKYEKIYERNPRFTLNTRV